LVAIPATARAQAPGPAAGAAGPECHVTPHNNSRQVPWSGNAGEIQWAADQLDCKVDTGNLPWIKVSVMPPVSGIAGRVLSYSVDTNFSPAKREGKILIGDSTVTIEQAAGPPPGMAYSPGRLEFKFQPGKDSSGKEAPLEITQSLFVGSEEPLAFIAKPDAQASWIKVKANPPGEGPQKQRAFLVTVSAAGKDPGVYRGSVQIEVPGASNPKEMVLVTLTVEKAK